MAQTCRGRAGVSAGAFSGLRLASQSSSWQRNGSASSTLNTSPLVFCGKRYAKLVFGEAWLSLSLQQGGVPVRRTGAAGGAKSGGTGGELVEPQLSVRILSYDQHLFYLFRGGLLSRAWYGA